MKYTKLILSILILLYVQTTNAQKWVNVSPFPDDYNGSVAGFFLTANEGWIWQISKYKANTLYYTSDGAETFEPIFDFGDSLTTFLSLQMTNKNIGYAKAKWQNNISPYNDTTYLLKTIDSGYSWNKVCIDTSFLNQFTMPMEGIYFFTDTLTGFTNRFIEGEGLVIFKTTNGAQNWQKSNITEIEEAGLIPVEVGSVTKFFFVDDMHGWATCFYEIDGGICLKTVDGGLTWQPAHNYGTPMFGLHFISPTKGGIVGLNAFFSHVYLTEDNFLSLSYENQAWDYEMQQYATTLCYQNDSIIWISGRPGIFFRSTDSGNSFQVFENVPDIYGDIYNIMFYGNTGYAFGHKNSLLKFQDTLVGVNDRPMKLNNKLNFIPNPACEIVQIELPQKSSGYLQIFNNEGKEVITMRIIDSYQVSINLTNSEGGILLVKYITENGKIYNQKLIKYN